MRAIDTSTSTPHPVGPRLGAASARAARRTPFHVVATLIALTIGSACPGDDGTPPPITCAENVDCPGVLLCLDGICADPTGVTCSTDLDCPANFLCLENGRCRANAACEVDSDCCADATTCESVCDNFQCIGVACEPGESEECFVGCHRGARDCVNGNWALCDALPVTTEEVCGDDVDNECNGATDDGCVESCTQGDFRLCDAACGEGTQVCGTDGVFGACETADGCQCDPAIDTTRTVACGACGFNDQSCGADGVWAADDVCQGEGECAAGDVETIACGACGEQTRTCGDDCTWGAFGACDVPVDACAPGTVETLSCGDCGSQTRTCNDACTFDAPTECVEGTGCELGDEQTQECGRCGVRVSTCDDTCTFGAFGECQDEGTCTPGEIEVEACGACGQRERVCGDNCEFGAFGNCEDEGECTPGQIITEDCGPTQTGGACQQGTRTLECDDTCRFDAVTDCEGAVFPGNEVCGNGTDENCNGDADDSFADQFEVNDSCATAFLIASGDIDTTVQPTIDHVTLDTGDFFLVRGVDNTGTAVEHFKVDLTGIPAGMDLDVKVYRGLTACQNDTPLSGCGPDFDDPCVSEAGGNAEEHLDFAETVFVDDGGDFFIRVIPFSGASCFNPYTLHVRGLQPN